MEKEQQFWAVAGGLFIAFLLFKKGNTGSSAGANYLGAGCTLPRGIRNNNPGNLKTSGSEWLGKVPIELNMDTDCTTGQVVKTFEQFYEYRYGIRALLKLLEKYMKVYNLRTIEQILSRYAPNSENPTSAYVATVANRMGVFADDRLNWDRETARELAQAIAAFENGREAITDAEFYDVWDEWWGGIAGTPALQPNTPVPSTRANKKRMVLASRGGRQEIIHYGDPDYRHNYSAEARRNYCARSAGIRDGAGRLTKDNPFSANYWSRKELWNC